MDRFIAVQFALKAKNFCTRKRAIIVSIVIFVLAFIKNTHLLFTRGLVPVETETTAEIHNNTTANNTEVEYVCGITLEDARHFETYVRPWIGFSLFFFIPIASMLLLNILIVIALIKIKRTRERKIKPDQTAEGQSQENAQSQGTGQPKGKRMSLSLKPSFKPQKTGPQKSKSGMSSKITSLTIMFLSVSIVWLLLITPSMSNIVALPYWVETDEDWDLFFVIAAVTDSFVYINHSINFLLYCISGRRFREEFLAMIGCKKKDQREVTMNQTLA